MSDEWQTYRCLIDDHPAVITYDHGLSDEFEGLNFGNVAIFRIPIPNPDERGLPVGDAFDHLNALEDYLMELLPPEQAVNAGRITCNGTRTVFFYTGLDQAACLQAAQQIEQHAGCRILLHHAADPTQEKYWEELFPTDEELQVIRDMRLHERLIQEGDPCTEPRLIRHWAYFPTVDTRQKFLDQVAIQLASLACEELYEQDGRFAVILKHTGLPDWQSMSPITGPLNNLATHAGGEYDGWETELRGARQQS